MPFSCSQGVWAGHLGHAPQLRGAALRCLQRKATRLDRARPGDLGEEARCGDHVAGEEDAPSAVDRGAVAPAPAGVIERTGAGDRRSPPPPGFAFAPAWQRDVEESVETQCRLLGALTGPDRHLRLDQLLALGGQRWVGGAEALDPAGLIEVGDNERIAAAMAEAEIDADRVAAGPLERVVAEQRAGSIELNGENGRSLRHRLGAVPGLDLHAKLPHPFFERAHQRAPAADQVTGGGWQAEQDPDRVLPDEGGGQLPRVVVERVDAGG